MAFLDETGLAVLWSATKGLAGKIDLHYWKRKTSVTSLPYTIGTIVTATANSAESISNGNDRYACFYYSSGKETSKTLYYSATIEVLPNGKLSLVNPQSLTFTYSGGSSTTTCTPVYGKFYKSAYNGDIYYAAPDTTCKAYGNSTYGYFFYPTKYAKVYPPEMPVWSGDVVTSSDPSAYPSNGIVGSYHYEYAGKPIERAVDSTRTITGSYAGTNDTTNKGSDVSVSVGFRPKVVVIYTVDKGGDSNSSTVVLSLTTDADAGGIGICSSSSADIPFTDVTITETGFIVAKGNKYGINFNGRRYGYIVFG